MDIDTYTSINQINLDRKACADLCYKCGQVDHLCQNCPLNSYGPAPQVGNSCPTIYNPCHQPCQGYNGECSNINTI